MYLVPLARCSVVSTFFLLLGLIPGKAQHNLLLNSSFEDINTCTEYDSECGVEAWFYMRDVKVQMLPADSSKGATGNNMLNIFYSWVGYKNFAPIFGTLLPCTLQEGKGYTFRGLISVKLNNSLLFKPGLAMGERFYVPQRPFVSAMQPDSITTIRQVGKTNFYRFEYHYTATGKERYLTFGSFIEQDTTVNKKSFALKETISITVDDFELIPDNTLEIVCDDYKKNKQLIYNYNFRHKEMDYSLFGKGELNLKFVSTDSTGVSRIDSSLSEKKIPKTDTLKIGDILFDLNKYSLKPAALSTLKDFFSKTDLSAIDSVYIEGHTDSVGTDQNNLALSQKRCESIRSWLLNNQIFPSGQMQVHAMGEARPVASNSTPEGRAMNRRVEIVIFYKQEETQ